MSYSKSHDSFARIMSKKTFSHEYYLPKNKNNTTYSKSLVDLTDKTATKVLSDVSCLQPRRYSEEKILNTGGEETEYDAFFAVCETFEKVLNKLNLTDKADKVYEKLTEIQELIKKKILFILSSSDEKKKEKVEVSDSQFMSSVLDNSAFQKFLCEVNCPFCSEIQSDKLSLIKHLDMNCSPHLKKEFKKEDHVPFCAFQILPNNTFKCNICCKSTVQSDLKEFYVHMNGELHVEAFAKVNKERDYAISLFCAPCRVLIYNNYTQISFHINHEFHKTRCLSKMSSKYFQAKGIHCVYTETKKFKCLVCPASASFNSVQNILKHLESSCHKNKKKSTRMSLVYCEICTKEVHVQNLISHFSANQHNANAMKLKENSFEICLYCGFVCDTLMELSFHMDYKCDEINSERQKILVQEKSSTPNFNENFSLDSNKGIRKEHRVSGAPSQAKHMKSKTGTKTETEVNSTGFCITVKNYTTITELQKYFKKFGEILSIESASDRDVVIRFREKSAVDAVLLHRDLAGTDTLKFKITEDGMSSLSNEVESTGRDNESEADRESDAMGEEQLDELFERVSSHLINCTQNLNSTDAEQILHDCSQALGVKSCDYVGWSGCGLSFPSESINLFCDLNNSLHESTSSEGSADAENLFYAHYQELHNSELFEDVKYGQYFTSTKIDCVHKKTKKVCTITATRSAMLLTDMLRECMTKCDHVRPFCLLIRFWLSVHELEIRMYEFPIISLLVFFLINKNVVQLSIKYDKYLNLSFTDTEYEDLEPSLQNIKPQFGDVKDLFRKFLLFLNTFDFDKFAICLPFRHPVFKHVFIQNKFKCLSDVTDPTTLLKCSMCILDPILLSNLASSIKKEERKEFLQIVRDSVNYYKIK